MEPATKQTDETQQIAKYWNDIANDFDAIYTGKKGPIGARAGPWLRRDIYQRYEWVMRESGLPDLSGMTICDIGCGSGRFVAALAKRGAQVTGLDFAPEMLKLSRATGRKGRGRGSMQVCAQRRAGLENGPEVRSGDCHRVLGLRCRPVAEIAGDSRDYEEDFSVGVAPRCNSARLDSQSAAEGGRLPGLFLHSGAGGRLFATRRVPRGFARDTGAIALHPVDGNLTCDDQAPVLDLSRIRSLRLRRLPASAVGAAGAVSRRASRQPVEPSVSLLVAAYNEAAVIADKIRNSSGPRLSGWQTGNRGRVGWLERRDGGDRAGRLWQTNRSRRTDSPAQLRAESRQDGGSE